MMSGKSARDCGKAVLAVEAEALRRLAKKLDGGFSCAVKLIAGCKGRVAVMGLGKSGLVGRKIASTLSSTGTPAFFLHPVECLHGDMGTLSKGDIVLALSYSGETEEMASVAALIKERGLSVIAITGRRRSRLGLLAKAAISCAVEKEACPHNLAPTASTTAMLALGDALAVALMKARGFKKSDFALLHPGGNLGKTLSLKVKDLMRTGAANPVVSENADLRKALAVMTATRLGAVSAVDKKGRLSGFFTDGDFRRLALSGKISLSAPVSSVMTKNPARVAPETPAVEAARLIALKRIDNLPVSDGKNRPVGIIDERDLLGLVPEADA